MAKLKHYGVLGMKWGKRKGGGSVKVGPGVRGAVKEAGGLFKDALKDDLNKIGSAAAKRAEAKKPSADSARAKELRKKSVERLSNDEIKTVITRMQLEKQYRDLGAAKVGKGNRFVSTLVQKIGGMAVNSFVRQYAGPNYAGYEAFAQAFKNRAKGG